jgi:hypothetical protein
VAGEAIRVAARSVDDGQVTLLDLPPCGHALLIASPEKGGPIAEPHPDQWQSIELEPLGIERAAPNVLPLLFCDLQSGGTTVEGVNTTWADEMNWKAHGQRGNIWSHSAQFRRDLIEMQFPEKSGFSVSYHFTVAPDAVDTVRSSLQVAVERPWLYEVALNGKTIRFRDGERWLDPDMRTTSIAAALQGGVNTITLKARPMRPLCEIMPLYVLGQFSLAAEEKTFSITEARSLQLGDRAEQGIPFYPGKVDYRYRFVLEQDMEKVSIRLPAWAGSAARVLIDESDFGVIAWPPDRLQVGYPLAAGQHELRVSVAGNLKNMLGPHFSDGLPGIWSWRWSGQTTQPPEKYKFAPSGLLERPLLAAAEAASDAAAEPVRIILDTDMAGRSRRTDDR